MSGFVHLHLHSEYSLLDGACRIGEIISTAKSMGQKAVAITDHGVMYGVVDFYKAAKEQGIKPIIGCEVYVAPRTLYDKQHQFDSQNNHLVLLVKNETGYKNLMKIVSKAYMDGFYIKPRTDLEELQKHSEGLICLSACLGGAVPGKILEGDIKGAQEIAKKYKEIFKEDYYLELQNHGMREQLEVNRALLEIGKELDIPFVATNDVHYIKKEDAYVQKVLMCIQTAKTIDEENAMAFPTDEFYFKSEQEMRELFGQVEGAIENTVKIANQCNYDFEFGKLHLPKFDLETGVDAYDYLRQQVFKGFYNRYGDNPSENLVQRLEYELSIIKQMGYVDYFLIVSDFIDFAKRNDIPVGPGRGSAAGSIVSYALGITDIDPIKYNLIFERFLNPERISMPDIDIDFCYERRGEVIDYVVEKYGKNRVAQIITFGTMAAKGAIRDVGRVLNIPYNEVDAVAKLVPGDVLHISIEQALKQSSALKGLYDTSEEIKRLIDTASRLEGMPRHSSVHAAGVVITGSDVDDFVPVQKSDVFAITQFTMGTLENLGLLKMDFLALRNLTVIKDAENIINATKNEEFSVAEAETDDSDVYKMLAEGNTSGVFQLESSGMRQMLTEMKPTCFEDIIAAISLYRPGPMDSIPTYIENMRNAKKIKYLTPKLEPILNMTYGCIIYQEQVMQIFREIAGYSFGRADLVRRAMSKKKADVLEKERKNFIFGKKNDDGTVDCVGAIANGVDEKIATKLFDDMASFASYAFNKSHAAAYAAVAYRTAYLKLHYPCEYMAALLTSVIGNTDKVVEYINECSKIGIEVLPPDVNESFVNFSVSGKNIRFGLVAIKSIGFGVINELIHERKKGGKFKSFEDFLVRMAESSLNKKAVFMLINAGAMDNFDLKRSQMLMSYESMMDNIGNIAKNNISGQTDLFGNEEKVNKQTYKDIPELSLLEKLKAEKEATGMYLTGHPLSEYQSYIDKLKPVSIKAIINSFTAEGEKLVNDNDFVTVAGVISAVKLKRTRNNTMMAFALLEDQTATIELVIFAKKLDQYTSLIKEDAIVAAFVRVSSREDEEPKLILEKLMPINNVKGNDFAGLNTGNGETYSNSGSKAAKKGLFIKVPSMSSKELEQALKIIKVFDGENPLYVYSEDTKKYSLAARSLYVAKSDVLVGELKKILGNDGVVAKF